MAKKKPAKAKAISYQLIPRETEHGAPMYQLLETLIDKHHEHLVDARIALAWNLSWKPDVDGRVTLGKCKKASDLDRELAPFDFVIMLRREFWQHDSVTDDQRLALLDHELMHAAVKYDDGGQSVVDVRGRTVYRIRKHDIEEFRDIVARHGCYKSDLEEFGKAIEIARAKAADGTWIGYRALREKLSKVGVTVPLSVVHEWTDRERREAWEWALLQEELQRVKNNTLWLEDSTLPAFMATALSETPQ